jgi:hypothetical protein
MISEENHDIKYLLPKSDEWTSLKPDIDGDADKNIAKQNQEILKQLLLSAMQMQNLVVLAGSGTSYGPVGGPSMNDLWDICTKKDNKYSSETKNICKKIDYDISEKSKVNIEEFLSLCEAHLAIKEDTSIKDFVDGCKQSILTACSFDKTDEKLSGHSTFIHRLSRRRVRDSRLKLFTTNYDTCFEKAAGNHGIIIIDGFSFTQPRQYDPSFFDYDIVRRTSNSTAVDNYLEGVFQLYKLHGSVNWEKQDDKIIEKDATPQGACMIFPAKGKYQQSYIQPHLELMARYLAVLREPNTCIVVVGFGFNDDHLSEPLISAIKSNPYMKVIVADYNAEKNIIGKNTNISHYWKLLKDLGFKGEDITFINASFEEFASLIPDLRSLTPAEKMVHAIKGIAGDNK